LSGRRFATIGPAEFGKGEFLKNLFAAVVEYAKKTAVLDGLLSDFELASVLPADMLDGNLSRNELGATEPAKMVYDLLIADRRSSHDQERFSR